MSIELHPSGLIRGRRPPELCRGGSDASRGDRLPPRGQIRERCLGGHDRVPAGKGGEADFGRGVDREIGPPPEMDAASLCCAEGKPAGNEVLFKINGMTMEWAKQNFPSLQGETSAW